MQQHIMYAKCICQAQVISQLGEWLEKQDRHKINQGVCRSSASQPKKGKSSLLCSGQAHKKLECGRVQKAVPFCALSANVVGA